MEKHYAFAVQLLSKSREIVCSLFKNITHIKLSVGTSLLSGPPPAADLVVLAPPPFDREKVRAEKQTKGSTNKHQFLFGIKKIKMRQYAPYLSLWSSNQPQILCKIKEKPENEEVPSIGR